MRLKLMSEESIYLVRITCKNVLARARKRRLTGNALITGFVMRKKSKIISQHRACQSKLELF